jgi:enoyl-CoA hydratase
MTDKVITNEVDSTLVITINRPERMNAIDRETSWGIDRAIGYFEQAKHLQVGILTGSGGTFCAGMDLKAFLNGEDPVLPDHGFAGVTQRTIAKPLIAAVEGWAVAGGCEIVLACDLVVAGEGARFGLPEVKRGLVAAAGGVLKLPRRIPTNIAKEIILTGDSLSAIRAHRLGLVNQLTHDGSALQHAVELATRIANNAPLAVAASKRVIDESQDWTMTAAYERQEPIVRSAQESEDAIEGARAFAERREPIWTAR